MKTLAGLLLTLLVAAAGWAVIAGIGAIALHLKHESEQHTQTQMQQQMQAPVWSPVEDKWVTP